MQALMPEAEANDTILELCSQCLGLGSFTRALDHLQEFVGRAPDQVVAARAEVLK